MSYSRRFPFLAAHGFDPGPAQRPLLAGTVTGALAAMPAAAVFVALGTFEVVAVEIMRLPYWQTALVLLAALTTAGAIYGGIFQRAANDRSGGWLLGLAFGFLLWMTAPVVALPLIPGAAIAAGEAALGFFLGFLLWGLTLGVAFPHVHRPLRADLDGAVSGPRAELGPNAAATKLLRQWQSSR